MAPPTTPTSKELAAYRCTGIIDASRRRDPAMKKRSSFLHNVRPDGTCFTELSVGKVRVTGGLVDLMGMGMGKVPGVPVEGVDFDATPAKYGKGHGADPLKPTPGERRTRNRAARIAKERTSR